MKKIIVIILCFILCILLAGCTPVSVSKLEGSTTYTNAMIIMPDGSIIKGECESFIRISSSYAMVKIDGVKYYTNEWRIVLWENNI
jgi:hypothetical protein